MNPPHSAVLDVLAECDALGVRLSLSADGGLAVDAPRDVLDHALLARLRDHKHELLDALRARQGAEVEAGDRGVNMVENVPVATVENVAEFTRETTPVDLAAAWALMVEELANDPTFPPQAVEALRVARVEWAPAGT